MVTNNGLNINAANPLSPLLGGTGSSSAEPIDEMVQQGAYNFAASSGAANAYVVTLAPEVLALTDGLQVVMTANHTNSGAVPTLQVNALGAVNIETNWGNLVVGDIVSNSSYLLVYNLSANIFILVNPTISTANTELLQSNNYNYALDSGAANAYVATLNPAPVVVHTPGLCVYLTAVHTNSGASTITVNGVTDPIVTNAGVALVAGDIVINGLYLLFYSSAQSAWVLVNPSVSPGTGTVNAGTTGQVAYYAGNGATVSGTTSLPVGTTLNGSQIAIATNSTFAPTVTFGGASTGITYGAQTGSYTLCGNVCNFVIYIQLTSKGSATGAASIQNLPTASRAIGGGVFVFPLQLSTAVLVGINGINGAMTGSSATILMTDQTGASLTDVNFNNNTEIFISGSYLF